MEDASELHCYGNPEGQHLNGECSKQLVCAYMCKYKLHVTTTHGRPLYHIIVCKCNMYIHANALHVYIRPLM